MKILKRVSVTQSFFAMLAYLIERRVAVTG